LTVAQALEDAAAVARQAELTLRSLSSASASEKRLPWIAVGGSYSGALSAWFRQTHPDLVVGAISSSGVVNALLDFPQFDSAVSAAVGARCGSVLRRLVAFADELLLGSAEAAAFARDAMNAPRGLSDDDYRYMMADSFSMAVQYGHKTAMCDRMMVLEDSTGEDLLRGFSNFTAWLWGEGYAAGCFYDTECLRGEPSRWGENGRAWRWQKCSQVAYLQRAPAGDAAAPPLRSPHLTLRSLERQCDRIFGAGTAARLPAANAELQRRHGGARPNGTDSIFFTNFSDDPWQEAGVRPLSSRDAGLPRCYVRCDDCGHCMDLHEPRSSDPKPLSACRHKAAAAVATWLADFRSGGGVASQ